MNTKSRIIALGTCAAIGAALAIPSIGGADAPAPLALNSYAVSGYKVSPNGKQPKSLVPTAANGKLPGRIIDLSKVQAGATINGAIGTEWTAAAAGGASGAAASFPLALPKRLSLTNFGIKGGAVEDPECDGTYEKPTSPAGHLCIYPGHVPGYYSTGEAEVLNVALNGEGNYDATAYVMSGVAGKYGFRVEVKAKAAGLAKFFATWSYTAPSNTTPAS
ncbi:MAG: hypothetical protein ACR2JV_06635 [Gaiellales bacterium]